MTCAFPSRVHQLQDNLASGVVLREDELARLYAASQLPLECPGWPFMEENDSIIRKHVR
ncbi:hypothetical protein [Cohnella nanjingensis]|uniref:Uncharacterized protein n=1 Tax=Cohnella nanjingensis TaxID=1387779 RepID=A0A7X0RU09_9BACL|nr:hypothetical protein [Cohnella nanjingensis]MBB6672139.1 hypothetical protein [Cohnella nanjingensis]